MQLYDEKGIEQFNGLIVAAHFAMTDHFITCMRARYLRPSNIVYSTEWSRNDKPVDDYGYTIVFPGKTFKEASLTLIGESTPKRISSYDPDNTPEEKYENFYVPLHKVGDIIAWDRNNVISLEYDVTDAVMVGFVPTDVFPSNTIFRKTATIIDAQKFSGKHAGSIFARDHYTIGSHAMLIPTGNVLSYHFISQDNKGSNHYIGIMACLQTAGAPVTVTITHSKLVKVCDIVISSTDYAPLLDANKSLVRLNSAGLNAQSPTLTISATGNFYLKSIIFVPRSKASFPLAKI
ncbi:hypothetical protein SAMD00019534_001270 [Acytostelium subglobosum LB1]|uniref:hypothetical protein n=1 Tax=Acytostelium subglobosum LB1 TaxID=1410327 RepID=UPI000644A184|nr:hypothetical protein SAMD00019534_001270 [Acytostelium subglobosum LB1]GAM16952.1 hypothetical protein SAMD00019534_001270 [Acytostelium subglobosum LB1]|eukprot:XP_012759014.1 hypothetical protein SAMD00019534_001270 [Acytostelium subglobosum LB1]